MFCQSRQFYLPIWILIDTFPSAEQLRESENMLINRHKLCHTTKQQHSVLEQLWNHSINQSNHCSIIASVSLQNRSLGSEVCNLISWLCIQAHMLPGTTCQSPVYKHEHSRNTCVTEEHLHQKRAYIRTKQSRQAPISSQGSNASNTFCLHWVVLHMRKTTQDWVRGEVNNARINAELQCGTVHSTPCCGALLWSGLVSRNRVCLLICQKDSRFDAL